MLVSIDLLVMARVQRAGRPEVVAVRQVMPVTKATPSGRFVHAREHSRSRGKRAEIRFTGLKNKIPGQLPIMTHLR